MGGIGSGGLPRRAGALVEDLFKFTVKELRLDGLLGSVFIKVMRDEKQEPVSITGDSNGVTVSFLDQGEHLVQRVEYDIMQQVLGGHQYYFACPCCAKKREALYIHNKVACRVCHGAVYASENHSIAQRAYNSRNTAAAKLDCAPDDIFPVKPPRMHNKTYELFWENLSVAQARCASFERERIEKWCNRERD